MLYTVDSVRNKYCYTFVYFLWYTSIFFDNICSIRNNAMVKNHTDVYIISYVLRENSNFMVHGTSLITLS